MAPGIQGLGESCSMDRLSRDDGRLEVMICKVSKPSERQRPHGFGESPNHTRHSRSVTVREFRLWNFCRRAAFFVKGQLHVFEVADGGVRQVARRHSHKDAVSGIDIPAAVIPALPLRTMKALVDAVHKGRHVEVMGEKLRTTAARADGSLD